MTNFEKIKDTINKNHGFITTKQIKDNNIALWALTEYIEKYKLNRVCQGFYATNDWFEDNYYIFQYKYPKYIFSYQCALYLNELTDRIPFQIEVTRMPGYNPRSTKGDEIIHTVTKDIYNLGIIEKETMFGNKVKAYDAERTICDIIKDRDNQDVEIFTKAIQWYNKSETRNLNKLMEYAGIMGIEKKTSEIFEVIAYED